jgi:type IV secretion system T-DNA border endonuclease VirD2
LQQQSRRKESRMKTKLFGGFQRLHFSPISIPDGHGRKGSLHEFAGGGATRARLGRNVSGVPQVMVKVTSWSKSSSRVGSHLDYISRNGSLELEDERGIEHRSKAEVRRAARGWFLEREDERIGRRIALNLALSMPKGTDPQKVLAAARRFAQREFHDRQYFLVLHAPAHDKAHRGVSDRLSAHKHPDHPHVHLLVKSMNDAGERLRVGPADLARFRETFAEELRTLGVAANASSRIERGIMRAAPKRKGARPRAMDFFAELLRTAPKQSTAQRRRAEEMLALARAGKPLELTPGEQREKAAYAAARDDYSLAIAKLRASGTPTDRVLADQLAAFAETMPRPMVEREQMPERAQQFTAAAQMGDQATTKPPLGRGRAR